MSAAIPQPFPYTEQTIRADFRARKAIHRATQSQFKQVMVEQPEVWEELEQSGALTDAFLESMRYDWREWARPQQFQPINPEWRTWLISAGRGWGKTRTGAEWIKWKVENGAKKIAFVGRTAGDVRDVMVEGVSGILNIFPPSIRPIHKPSKRQIEFHTGAVANLFSAKEPDLLRGPQFDCAWADELASWRNPDSWSNLMFGLRLPPTPQIIVTTTPRPTPIIKDLLRLPSTVVTMGTSYDNLDNLAESFFNEILGTYEGTRLGRQEIYAELLDDAPGALWNREKDIDAHRWPAADTPDFVKIVVAIDPAVTGNANSNETGIIVAGLSANGHVYILDDLTPTLTIEEMENGKRITPADWAKAAIRGYKKWHADLIVAEVNNGGDLVEQNIRAVNATVPYKAVRASRGKLIRAEPIASLYEQGRVHHTQTFAEMEDQMVNWEPGDPSPDRLDALVWAITELALADGKPVIDYGPIDIPMFPKSPNGPGSGLWLPF